MNFSSDNDSSQDGSFLKPEPSTDFANWYCVKCQPKHEHIAAGHLSSRLGIPVLCPRIRFKKSTARGVIWFVEALFPGYLFAHFDFTEHRRNIQYSTGVSGIVHFGDKYPTLDDATIRGIEQFQGEESYVTIEPTLSPGDDVEIGEGAFCGMKALVHSIPPAGERIRVLIEFLGRVTEIEVNRRSLVSDKNPGSLIGDLFGDVSPA